MAEPDYYTGVSDVDIAKDAIAQDPDLHIQKIITEETGVYAEATTSEGTLTPTVSPAWTVAGLVSTVAYNLEIVDDNAVVGYGKVTDNDADSITFDPTDVVLASDATTPITLTDTDTYSFKVFTPSSTVGNDYGPFFGLSEGNELSITDEYMQYKYGMPKKKLFQDLVERVAEVNGGTINYENKDVQETIFGSVEFGGQTGQQSTAIGSDPGVLSSYRLAFKLADRNGRRLWIIIRKVQFGAEGNIFGKSTDGYSMSNFKGTILADTFYPENADMIQIIRID
jgi:hypothetical protein